jgi:signal transduction histidine kinase
MAIERLVTPGALSLIREAGRRMGTATGQVLPSTEGEILRLDGQQVPVEMTGVAVRYGDTPVLQLVIRDITERKREGDALRQANKKLNILNVDTLNAIRNQVFTLNGYLSLMKEPASPDKAREYGDKAGEAIKAITAQLEFIRHYQNMGIQHSRWQKVHDAYLFALSHIAIGQIERYESVTGVEIFADPLLEQVFFGLIDNSLRHGKHVTRISLTSVEIEGALGIVFEDNGVGVPDAGKNAIFELKYGKGGGIGLFLIREVLGITGITIRETGTYGSGARFEIRVPKGYYRFGKR